MPADIKNIFNQFENTTALVIGDVMLDTYLFGTTDRISPEAPVPVVNIDHKESRLGGAANVALNIKSVGAKPILCSTVGDDEQADVLEELLKRHAISSGFLIRNEERHTTEKSRVFSRNHQMLRFDRESDHDINAELEAQMIGIIRGVLEDKQIDVVVMQDYNKGVLTPHIIHSTIELCVAKGIPVAVDPKKENFFAYQRATLFKPNLKEINSALTLNITGDLEVLNQAAEELHKNLDNELTLITLGEKGIFVSDHKEGEIIPGTVRNIADVSGAGDTVIGVAALCLAQNLDKTLIAKLSNIAGGLACESVGVRPVDKEQFWKDINN